MRRIDISLKQQTPLRTHRLTALVFGGPEDHPHAYLQAGLHADEVPAFLTMVHLRRRLCEIESEGLIAGRVTLVPVANPIGLSQRVLGEPEGRYDLADGKNFNRGFPDLSKAALSRLGGERKIDAGAVREALTAALDAEDACNQTSALRLALMRLALDADLVLDLHSDINAVLHLVTVRAFATSLAPLAARLGAARMLLTNDGGPPRVFDEAMSLPRLRLAERFPEARLVRAATIELRGNRDVDHENAKHDANAILDYLAVAGIITRAVTASASSPARGNSCRCADAGYCDEPRNPGLSRTTRRGCGQRRGGGRDH
jgi:hypothetical protein